MDPRKSLIKGVLSAIKSSVSRLSVKGKMLLAFGISLMKDAVPSFKTKGSNSSEPEYPELTAQELKRFKMLKARHPTAKESDLLNAVQYDMPIFGAKTIDDWKPRKPFPRRDFTKTETDNYGGAPVVGGIFTRIFKKPKQRSRVQRKPNPPELKEVDKQPSDSGIRTYVNTLRVAAAGAVMTLAVPFATVECHLTGVNTPFGYSTECTCYPRSPNVDPYVVKAGEAMVCPVMKTLKMPDMLRGTLN